MTIRKAVKEDLTAIYDIYEGARSYMLTHGNPDQWGTTYPPRELTLEDIRQERLYVITGTATEAEKDADTDVDTNTDINTDTDKKTETGKENKQEIIEAVFVFDTKGEEAYNTIEGKWSYDEPYGVIHRVASSGRVRNITRTIFNFSLTKVPYIRIDTHRDNTTMQSALLRYGFRRCGTIYYTRNNSTSERTAFDFRA